VEKLYSIGNGAFIILHMLQHNALTKVLYYPPIDYYIVLYCYTGTIWNIIQKKSNKYSWAVT